MESKIKDFLKSAPENFELVAEVTSPSMEPIIEAGDSVVIRKIKFGKIKEGDIVAFSRPGLDRLVVHRVKKRVEKDDKLSMVTRGDRALGEDRGELTEENYLGLVIAKRTQDGNRLKLRGPGSWVVSLVLKLDYALAHSKRLPRLNLGIKKATRASLKKLASLASSKFV